MKLKYRYIIGLGFVLCGLLGFASCTGESFEPLRREDNSIFLTFRAAVAGASTRADGEEKAADEVIKQLLVVIVSGEETAADGQAEGEAGSADGICWVVEHSRVITKDASIGIPLYDGYTFKVKAGCRKRIYLIANYEGLKDAEGKVLDFGDRSFIPGTDGTVPVDNFIFALNEGNGSLYAPDKYGMPMTAMYEIDVPARKELRPENTDEYELPKTLYLVRAATKYSFHFKNTSVHRSIWVRSVDIERVIADRMYLMPHVNKDTDTDGKEKYWVVSNNDKAYLPPNSADSWFTNREWIDWMVGEADKTGDNETETDIDEQWLTDYEVAPYTPKSGEEASADGTCTYRMEYITPLLVSANTDRKKDEELPFVSSSQHFYLPESRSRIDGNDLLEQAYTLRIHTTETSEGNVANNRTQVYTSPLPHLASLFRNTHVKVNIVFNDHDVKWQVDVEPYWEVVLDPIFGLDDPKKESTHSDQSGQ